MSITCIFFSRWTLICQDTRLLLVVSNLVYAHDTLLPAMFNELETAFGISGSTDRRVRH